MDDDEEKVYCRCSRELIDSDDQFCKEFKDSIPGLECAKICKLTKKLYP